MNKINLEFKAYDKKENVMCKVGVISFNTGGCFLIGNSPTHDEYMDNGSIIEGPKEGHFVKFEDLELLQLSSYKDKNGFGIFEKDILIVNSELYIVHGDTIYDLCGEFYEYEDSNYVGYYNCEKLCNLNTRDITLLGSFYDYKNNPEIVEIIEHYFKKLYL